MTAIQIQEMKDAVRVGRLVDLSNDYRTSTVVRATLPEDIGFAMSLSAFQQYVQQGTAEEMDARLQALCDSLQDALGANGTDSQSDFEFTFGGKDDTPRDCRLKLEWSSSADKYGVILLPHEHLQFAHLQEHH